MRKLLPIALFVLPLAACTHGGGSGVSPMTDQTSGVLKMTSEKSVSNGAFDSGACTNLSPLIKVGTTETFSYSQFAGDSGARSLNVNYQVMSVDPSTQSFVTKLSGPQLMQLAGVSSVNINCHLSSSDDGTVCDGANTNKPSEKPSTDETCYVQVQKDASVVVGDGTLALANDRKSVQVHEVKVKGSGELYCNDKDTGMTGTTESMTLFSKDAPQISDNEGTGCQSGVVFMYEKVVDANGKVRAVHKGELLSLTVP